MQENAKGDPHKALSVMPGRPYDEACGDADLYSLLCSEELAYLNKAQPRWTRGILLFSCNHRPLRSF
jgi:hypothetical protein